MKLKIEELRPLSTISFWAWERARSCIFSLASGRSSLNKKLLNQNYSRVQIKGILYHEMLQAYIENKIDITNYDTFLNELVKFKERHLNHFDFSNDDISGWSETLDVFDTLADYNTSPEKSHQEYISYFEKELRFEELMGKPDLFFKCGDAITLYEFKSTELKKEDHFKEEYVRQLHFYSYLIKSLYGTFPRELFLIGLREGAHSLLLDINLCEWIAEDARSKYILFNKSVMNSTVDELNENLAKPSAEVCRYCNLRSVCTKYQHESEMFKSGVDNFHVASGDFVISEGKGKAYLSLDVFGDRSCARVLNVPSRLIGREFLNKYLVLYNLKKLGVDTFSFDRFSKIEFYG